jgi:hypothetical protein
MCLLYASGKVMNCAQIQWAPTLTVHDPNPPITLENVKIILPVSYVIWTS